MVHWRSEWLTTPVVILASRTPWTVWKGKKIWHGRWVPQVSKCSICYLGETVPERIKKLGQSWKHSVVEVPVDGFFFFLFGSQPWIFIGRTDAETEAPILWPLDVKKHLTGKDPDAGKDWGQEEKGMAEDEMVGWHHRLNGHECEQILGDSEGQGSLVCCRPWGCKVRNDVVTEQQPVVIQDGQLALGSISRTSVIFSG